MKDLPRKTPLTESGTPLPPEGAHPDDITPEFEAGTQLRAHRRTTVTVERETLSVYTRRPVSGSVVAPATHPADGKMAPVSSEKSPPGSTPEAPNDSAEGKP